MLERHIIILDIQKELQDITKMENILIWLLMEVLFRLVGNDDVMKEKRGLIEDVEKYKCRSSW